MNRTLHHRVQTGKAFHGGIAQALVAVDRASLAGRFAVFPENGSVHGEHLAVEATLFPRLLGACL